LGLLLILASRSQLMIDKVEQSDDKIEGGHEFLSAVNRECVAI